jgi:hypothetical protein
MSLQCEIGAKSVEYVRLEGAEVAEEDVDEEKQAKEDLIIPKMMNHNFQTCTFYSEASARH